MAFWGMGQAGKDAKGMTQQIPAWLWDTYQNQAGRGNEMWNEAQAQRARYTPQLWDMYNQGLGTPEDVLAAGGGLFPGYQDTMQRIRDRAGQLPGLLDRIPSAGQTADTYGNVINELGDSLRSTSQATDAETNDAFRRMADTASGVHGDIISNIGDTYKTAGGIADSGYGNIFNDIAGTYGGLTGSSADAYKTARGNLEALKPGGEAQAARVARSFAPLMRATNDRLRSFGINPNSPEAASQLREVGASRARAMDDATANSVLNYTNMSNDLTLGEQAAKERLGLGQLSDKTANWNNKIGTNLGLALQGGKDFQNEQIRNQGITNALEGDRLGTVLGNLNTAYDRTANLYGQKMNVPLLLRSLGMEDYQNQLGMLDAQNNADLTNFGVQGTVNNAGGNLMDQNLGARQWALGNVGNNMGNLYNMSTGLFNQAGNYANSALGGYQNTYNTEQANGGWGKKILGTAAGIGMNIFAPGIGSMLGKIPGTIFG